MESSLANILKLTPIVKTLPPPTPHFCVKKGHEIQTGHISKFTPNVKDPSFSVYKKGQAHPQFLCKKWYGIQTGQYFIVHTNYQAPFHFLCKKGHGIQIGQYFNVHSNFQAPPILFKKCHGIQIGQYFYVHSNCQVTPPISV